MPSHLVLCFLLRSVPLEKSNSSRVFCTVWHAKLDIPISTDEKDGRRMANCKNAHRLSSRSRIALFNVVASYRVGTLFHPKPSFAQPQEGETQRMPRLILLMTKPQNDGDEIRNGYKTRLSINIEVLNQTKEQVSFILSELRTSYYDVFFVFFPDHFFSSLARP